MKTFYTLSLLLGLICLFFGFVASITHAQNDVPAHPADGEYI